MYEDYFEDLSIIRYHLGSSDPFYNYNSSESQTRFNYYPESYVPHGFFDGVIDGEYFYSTWRNLFLSRMDVSSPAEITLTGTYDPRGLHVELDISVTATDEITFSSLRLFCVLVESDLLYSGRVYDQVMRDMIPNANGETFDIENGETVNFERDFTVDNNLLVDMCDIVVFVQDRTTREILQTARVPVTNIPTGVDDFPQGNIPKTVLLSQNYPNPFNSGTNIAFNLKVNSEVNLSVYNITGQKVAELANGKFDAGTHVVNWNAANEATGIYFYRLQANGEVRTNRMVLMK